jgi:hypothetical protein
MNQSDENAASDDLTPHATAESDAALPAAPSPQEQEVSSEISSTVDELAGSVDFGVAGCLRTLRDAVHARMNSNWQDESQVCVEVLRLASKRIDAEILIGEFAELSGFWMNLIVFQSILGAVDFRPTHIAKLERSLTPDIYRDLAIGGYLESIRRWAGTHPQYGEELVDLMLTTEGTPVRRLHVAVLQGLADAVLAGTYSKDRFDERLSASLAGSDDLRGGLLLTYPTLVELGLVAESEYQKCLEEFISPDVSDEVVGAAVRSILVVLTRQKEPKRYLELLRRAASDQRPLTQFNLVAALRPLAEIDSVEVAQLLAEIVPTLRSIAISNPGTIHELSWTLFALAESHAQLVMCALRAWAEREDDDLPIWHSKRFLHVINHLPMDTFASESILWLVEAHPLEKIALRLILDERQMRSIPLEVVERMTPTEVEICTLTLSFHDSRLEVVHLLACLVRGAMNRQDCASLSPLFENLLARIVANYPGTAKSVLDSVKRDDSSESRKVVQRLRRLMREREAALKTVHAFSDFLPAEDHQRIYQRFDRQFQRSVHRGDIDDPGRFPFLSMLRPNEVQLLGGGTVLSTDSASFGSVLRLGRISVETELPRLQLLDPQSEQMRRLELRTRIEELRTMRKALGATATA